MASDETYGHDIPPFKTAVVKMLRAGMGALSAAELEALAGRVGARELSAVGAFVGADGLDEILAELDEDKRALVAAQYAPSGDVTDDEVRRRFPALMAAINNALPAEALAQSLAELRAEDLASPILFLGPDGCRAAFGAMKPEVVRLVLDRTDDWVFLVAARRATERIEQYTATLLKQERLGKKLQGLETIELKVRESPKAIYMRWLDGPHKRREMLYNAERFGPDKIRARVAGLLGVGPVTIGMDSAVAKRGTNHIATEVGFRHMLELIDADYRKAAPLGEVRRVSHGLGSVEGRKTYRMESILPRDPSKGYYCHRMVLDMDYLDMIAVGCEVYNFDDQLQESFRYRDVQLNPALTEANFDPANKAYKLR